MSYHLLNLILKLNYLIKSKSTGTPKELAEKLEISERSLYDYISLLKQFQAPIKYSKIMRTYYYIEKGDFEIGFKKRQF